MKVKRTQETKHKRQLELDLMISVGTGFENPKIWAELCHAQQVNSLYSFFFSFHQDWAVVDGQYSTKIENTYFASLDANRMKIICMNTQFCQIC